jgi:hypothetical protein
MLRLSKTAVSPIADEWRITQLQELGMKLMPDETSNLPGAP